MVIRGARLAPFGFAPLRRAGALVGLCVPLALLAARAVVAQDLSVQASVDRQTVRDNESFTYIVRAEGSLRAEPEMQPLEQEFEVLQRTSNARIQIVNGRTEQVTEWTFQLMPKATGRFTLPPVRVGDAWTNAVELEVLPADSGGSAPADIFMEIETEPSTVYVQSQLVYTLRLFVGVSTGRATLTPPEVSGEAIVERLGEDRQYQTARGDRTFIVRERRYAIFPQQAGPLTIGPATFEAMVIPDRGFSRVQRFRSGSVDLTVQPAVPPPPTMADAVWLPARRVALSERWSDDAQELPLGIPRTRTITIEADGLLDTQLPEVRFAALDGIKQYADQPELEREVTAEGLRARRVERFAVIAQAAGSIEMPGLELPWWNVAEKRWEVARLEPRTIVVLPGAEPATDSADAAEPEPAAELAAESIDSWAVTSAALATGWLATVLLWWRSHVRGARARPARAKERPRRRSNRRLLKRLRAACAAHDPDAARSVLLQWAELRFPEAPPRSLGALAAVLPDGVAREVLELEAHIYGAADASWHGQQLAESLAALDSVRRPRGDTKADALLPLYR